MNTDRIAYLINNPASISAADLFTIEEIKTKYPYCSTLHMLYIKALALGNSIHFEEELKKSAIHVNDREKLHDLINFETSLKPTSSISKKVVTEEIIEIDSIQFLEKKSEKIEQEPIVETEIKKEFKINVFEKPIEPIIKEEPKPIVVEEKKDKVDMEKIIEDIRIRAEASRNKTKLVEKEGLKPILPTSIKEINTPEVIEQGEPIERLKEKTLKQDIIEDTIQESLVITEIKTTPLMDVSFKEGEIEPTTTSDNSPLELDVMAHAIGIAFELDVDNIIKSQTEEEEIKPELDLKEVEVSDPNNLSFTDWLKYKQGKLKIKEEVQESEKIKLSKSEIDDLLNKFIAEEPKMARPQKEFYNPVKNAKKSLDDTTVLVSETLAKIYWMQKNYEKAIRAYEQLSLRNPEKKTFFANQIKKIKQEFK
jgi:hypothetical protein